MENKVYKRLLLGLGMDCEDGHIRITKGNNFRIFGGSKETHEMMQEKAIKFNESLTKRGKSIDEIKMKEFYDIAHEIGLKVPKQKKKDNSKGGERNG